MYIWRDFLNSTELDFGKIFQKTVIRLKIERKALNVRIPNIAHKNNLVLVQVKF
jgi:hypothetical protein